MIKQNILKEIQTILSFIGHLILNPCLSGNAHHH